MEVTVRDGQTLADIAIQEYGSLEALPELARVNGLSVSQDIVTGRVLQLPQLTFNRMMQGYCKDHGVRPATMRGREGDARLRVFTKEFTKDFI